MPRHIQAYGLFDFDIANDLNDFYQTCRINQFTPERLLPHTPFSYIRPRRFDTVWGCKILARYSKNKTDIIECLLTNSEL